MPSIGLEVDGARLDGKPLQLADVGGLARALQLFQFCLAELERST